MEKIVNQIELITKRFNMDIHNLDEQDLETISATLEAQGLVNHSIVDITVRDACYLEVRYFSKKLQKSIVFDEDLYFDTDNESIEEMAKSIIKMNEDISKFENSINFK